LEVVVSFDCSLTSKMFTNNFFFFTIAVFYLWFFCMSMLFFQLKIVVVVKQTNNSPQIKGQIKLVFDTINIMLLPFDHCCQIKLCISDKSWFENNYLFSCSLVMRPKKIPYFRIFSFCCVTIIKHMNFITYIN
jgi:hypothetical protein